MSMFVLLIFITFTWASPIDRVFPETLNRNSVDSRIINGNLATLGQFPWQVALNVRGVASGWFCGGVIIHPEWILTAGHCVPLGSIQAYIWAGIINFSEAIPVTESNELFAHESYTDESLADDIGLIKLPQPLTFNDSIRSIPIASAEILPGVPITVSGFGANATGGGIQDLLKYVQLITVTNSECRSWYGDEAVTDGMVCAVSDENPVKSPCHGDSGGPAVINANGNASLVGLVSWVHDVACESTLPQGYTRAVYYRDWIRRITGLPL